MRLIYLLMFMIGIIIIQTPPLATAAVSACTSSICTVDVTRSITTNDWGTTFVNDTVQIRATSAVSSMTLGIPSSMAGNIHQMTAKDEQGQTVQVNSLATNQTGQYQPFQFAFPGSESGNYTFTIRSVFSDLISYDSAASKYTFAFSAFPVVDSSSGDVSANVTLLTRDWPTPVTIPGNATASGGKLSMPTTGNVPVKAFNATVWKTTFSAAGTSQNMFDVAASRTINILSGGSIHVSDTYSVANKGRDAPNIVFSLPPAASSVTCNDLIGQLDPSNCPIGPPLADGSVPVTFSPRFSTVKNAGAAVATLQYTLSKGTYVSATGLGEYNLTFNLFNNVKFVTSSLQTKIIFPTGGRLGTVTGRSPDVSGGQVLLEESNVTPYTNLAFTMTYSLDPFWASLAPLSWVTLIVGGIAAGALILSSGPQTGGIGLAPLQAITRFVELYDEKSSLRLEGEKLEEDVARGAVAKYDYKRRRRVMDLRLVELDRTLNPLKEELSSSQSRYAEMFKRVERAEAELQQVKTSLEDLRNQNRSGRISRQLYDQLSTDLIKRRNRAQQTIDNIIIGLREEAR